MIRSLKLENFKGIKKGEIDLAPLSILLGSNNVGKTTILESIFLAPDPLRRTSYSIDEFNDATALDVIHSMHSTLDSEGFSFLLYNYIENISKIYINNSTDFDTPNNDQVVVGFYKVDNNIYLHSNKFSRTKVNFENSEITCYNSIYANSKQINFIPGDNLFINDVLFLSSTLDQYAYNYLKNHWSSIVNKRICKNIAKDASKLSPDKYDDITIEPFLSNKLTINAYFSDGKRIRLGDLGEGMKKYIIARILASEKKFNTFLWDDIESHLNPKILSDISVWFNELINDHKQVIVTTHSLETAKILSSINNKHAKIYAITNDEGVLNYNTYNYDEILKMDNAGIDVRF